MRLKAFFKKVSGCIPFSDCRNVVFGFFSQTPFFVLKTGNNSQWNNTQGCVNIEENSYWSLVTQNRRKDGWLMGIYLNPGNNKFKRAVNSDIYVDKTGLIKYTNSIVDTLQSCVCVSRPRRFGKSMAADMLTAYYSKGCDSRELFMNYNIAQTEYFEKYLNKYDVIHLDMQRILMDAGAPERISGYINKNVISELADLYKDIDLRDQKTLYGALSVINSMTNNKFVIIIDEWDVLIRDEAANSSVQEEYFNFLLGMFK